jgi:hypothetical protein
MHVRYVIAVSSLAIALPLASVLAQTTTPEPAKWSFSLGVDPTHFDLHTPEPGVEARMVANLTRSWQSGNSRFARHISLLIGMDAPRQSNPIGDTPCDCPIRYSARYAGLTAGASLDLLRVSRFTPYLTGGTGLYYGRYGMTPANGYLTTRELRFYPNGFSQSSFTLGVNGGFGLKVRIGSRELYVEQVLHSFDANHLGTGVNPLNIGIRF